MVSASSLGSRLQRSGQPDLHGKPLPPPLLVTSHICGIDCKLPDSGKINHLRHPLVNVGPQVVRPKCQDCIKLLHGPLLVMQA